MKTDTRDNVLYELAQSMASDGGLAAAVALRKLAWAGYTNLDEVDSTPDWILLAIRGLGVTRLGAVRRLTRPDWQPPSPNAVRAINRFLSAARLALRFWPAETLASVILGSEVVLPPDQPYERRLAVELLSRATHIALSYCRPDELMQIFRAAQNRCGRPDLELPSVSGVQARPQEHTPPSVPPSTGCTKTFRKGSRARETDHFAYPERERWKIVQHYRAACERGEVLNKDSWASEHYRISGRTLLRYEGRYEQAEAESR